MHPFDGFDLFSILVVLSVVAILWALPPLPDYLSITPLGIKQPRNRSNVYLSANRTYLSEGTATLLHAALYLHRTYRKDGQTLAEFTRTGHGRAYSMLLQRFNCLLQAQCAAKTQSPIVPTTKDWKPYNYGPSWGYTE